MSADLPFRARDEGRTATWNPAITCEHDAAVND